MRNKVRWILLAFHLLFMGWEVYFAFMTRNFFVNLGFAVIFLVILVNLAVGKRQALTIACCLLILLLAGYYLSLLGVLALAALPAPVLRPLFIAQAFQFLVAIATIVFVSRASGKEEAAGGPAASGHNRHAGKGGCQ